MLVSQAKVLIKNIAEKEIHVSLLMVGASGIGKSQVVEQAANELNIPMIDLRLAQDEPGDLVGIPYSSSANVKVVSSGADDIRKTRWAKPEWWPEEGTKGILFLDEINRAPVDVRQAIFQLILNWRIHTHKLPKGWVIVSAMNPDNGSFQVETLDKAMRRRFCQLRVTTDVDSWMKWAHGHDVEQSIIGFIGTHKELLWKDEKFEIEAEPNPDAYRMLDQLIKAQAIPRELETDVFTGLLGSTAAIAFRKYLDEKYSRPVSGDDALNDYKKVKAKIKKQRSDENFVTIQDMIALMEADLGRNKKPKKDQVENLTEFILDVPDDVKAMIIQKLPRDWMQEIINVKELTKIMNKVLHENQ